MRGMLVSFVMLASIWVGLIACDRLNGNLSKEKQLALSEKCAKAGREFFRDYAVGYSKDYFFDEPQFHYSRKLNTCVIHIRYVYMPAVQSTYSLHHNQVIDVFSNRVILRGWFERDMDKETLMDAGGDAPNYTSMEYFKRKKQMFSE